MDFRRRSLVSGGVALMAAPRIVLPQPTGKLWRIGYLSESWPRNPATTFVLTTSGYIEGRDFVVDYKFADGQRDRLPALAAELVASKADVLIGLLNPEIAALIVMMYATAPVEMGFVSSLAKPGGNITGTTTNVPQMAGKMVQILRETVPAIKRIVVLADLSYPGFNLYVQSFEAAIVRLRLTGKVVDARTVADLDAALAEFERDRPDAIFVTMVGVVSLRIARIVEVSTRLRLPALYSIRGPVEQGGLISYAADFRAMAVRNAWQIDRILKGAKPSDISVEEPARFLLTINLKTAKAMGLTIPQSLLLQADEVIQ